MAGTGLGSLVAQALSELAAEKDDLKLAGELKIDRRRIKALRQNNKDVSITLRELDRLDEHLLDKGGLLDMLRGRRRLFRLLSQRLDVNFLIGAHVHEYGPRVSLFDFQAAISLQDNLTQARVSAQLPPQIFHTVTASLNDGSRRLPVTGSPRTTAQLCLGSSMTNPYAEVLLGELLPEGSSSTIWLGFPRSPPTGSRFARNKSEWRDRGVHVDGKEYFGDSQRSYGLVVAGEDSSGLLRIVCAGTTGDATLAGVQLLPDLAVDMGKEPLRVLVAVIEVNPRRNTRRIVDERILTA